MIHLYLTISVIFVLILSTCIGSKLYKKSDKVETQPEDKEVFNKVPQIRFRSFTGRGNYYVIEYKLGIRWIELKKANYSPIPYVEQYRTALFTKNEVEQYINNPMLVFSYIKEQDAILEKNIQHTKYLKEHKLKESRELQEKLNKRN